MATYATRQQIIDAYMAMSDAERAFLHAIAADCIQGTGFTSPTDLIHEALFQCLDGRFRWALPAEPREPGRGSSAPEEPASCHAPRTR